jgi:hypothetical protein
MQAIRAARSGPTGQFTDQHTIILTLTSVPTLSVRGVLIDLHAHVTDDVPAQLARAGSAGLDRTVLLSTRVHPETPRTLNGIRAEFGRLATVIGGQSTAIDEHRRAHTELRRALDTHPGRTWGFVNAPLDLPPHDMMASHAATPECR